MVPFIPRGPAGAPAEITPLPNPTSSQGSSVPFESAMQNALATNPQASRSSALAEQPAALPLPAQFPSGRAGTREVGTKRTSAPGQAEPERGRRGTKSTAQTDTASDRTSATHPSAQREQGTPVADYVLAQAAVPAPVPAAIAPASLRSPAEAASPKIAEVGERCGEVLVDLEPKSSLEAGHPNAIARLSTGPAQAFTATKPPGRDPEPFTGAGPESGTVNSKTSELWKGADVISESSDQPVQTESDRADGLLVSGPAIVPTVGSGAAILSLPGAAPPITAGEAQVPSHVVGGLSAGLGISSAQEEISMKKAVKMPKTAEPAEQNLPGSIAVSAGSPQQTALAESVPNHALGIPAVGEAQSASLERTHDLVATHALRLIQSGDDTVRVVLEPGSGTRLSLELRFAHGAVEAQAQLHRGDYDFLSTHWSELQQRLESRGIHLGALGLSGGSTGEQGHSTHSGDGSDSEPSSNNAFAQFAFEDGVEESRQNKRRSKTHAGWERWA